ncbi:MULTISPECIES: Fe-S protein assembly co-chaperone HscB [unclassified Herbaspirillum]|uniref:Fe-S protein assembly co-chaperone HscB n=1 Tax=unclassified Herbaspirillum TaxID=2624150 RepID=UPI000C0B45C1|nr:MULTISPECIES: Fe-S protein assembly co-chaperone HscB [unclassified Herbaspirillum]MAF05523.1 Fe-S protein assembly co-chaperone HscB [Herbaspirillum sp.]MBO17715.1 Fe-S protein assembly co-chaperone HscB [Herbaspirillum sp.]|tara:strand:- start:5914 stop:6429 length:516 start_codon:yes stop_codon:yes gene_type:complete
MQNHFDLFHLPQRFAIDQKALEQAFHSVQGQAHPDKFAHASDAEKRVAMQWATRANEAYQTLKNPLKRARYLCELHGVDLQTESNTAMAPGFLMQQMEWRETLDDAKAGKDIDALEQLNTELLTEKKAEIARIEALLDAGDYAAAGTLVRQLMFLDKFGAEIGDAFALIEG